MQTVSLNPTVLLKNAHLKVTRARQELLANFNEFDRPFTADDVCSKLQVSGGGVHRATVYRDMSTFARSGILKELSIHGTKAHYYELVDGTHHHHFVCKNCISITAILSEKVETTLEKFEHELTQQELKVEYHSLKFYGLCARCAK